MCSNSFNIIWFNNDFLGFLEVLILVILVLIAVAFFTLGERKVMATIQGRRGPNVVGYLGLLQPFADGLKLFCKENIIPANASTYFFSLAPTISFILSGMGWAVIPLNEEAVIFDFDLGIFYLLCISSLNIYGILLAGWASNSKYAFLGSIRAIAQMISYEISIGFIVIVISLCSNSFNLREIVFAQTNVFYCWPLLPLFFIFLVSILVETNRHPFDLAEAESELVSGFNVEYSSMPFALFFLAEYSNMLLMGAVISIFFLGDWLPPFSFMSSWTYVPDSFWFGMKISLIAYFYCVVRAVLPRFRYDQLMLLGWKNFLPFVIGFLIFVVSIFISFNILI